MAGHPRRKVGISWLYTVVILFNLLVFAGIGLIYSTYMSAYRQKLYDENLKNVANLNAASANAADMYFSSMDRKLSDVAAYLENVGATYDQAREYLGVSNTETDRQFQLIRSGYYENGVLVPGDYAGVSIRLEERPDGSLARAETEVSYAVNYYDLTRVLRDFYDEAFERVCFTPEFTDADTKLKCFAIYRHIALKDGEGRERLYTMLLSVNSKLATDVYNLRGEYANQSTVLMNESGDYIISNSDFKGLNFYEYLRTYNDLTLDEKTSIRKSVSDALLDGESVNLFYQNSGKEDCVFCVTGMNNHWYSVTSVPVAAFNLENDQANYSLIILALFIALFAVDGIVIAIAGKAMRRNILIARNATREAEIANQAKSRFLSTMSHELRTPLNAILGLVSLSGDHIGDPPVLSDYFHKIDASAKLLLQLISDILDVSAIESNKMRINHSEFDLTKVIASLSSLYYDQCANKGVEFKTVLVNMHSETLIGDSMRLNQILLNFLSNAVKFTPSGGRITLKAEQVRDDGNAIVIRFDVIDTGCGVSDELKSRLFRPFEQESGDTVRKYGGTGLGLSIAKNLTELMNGRVEMESEAGAGSRFSAEIPFDVPAQRTRTKFHTIKDMRTLVVIDDTDTREYVGQILANFGMEHELTDCAEKAFALLEHCARANAPFMVCIRDWQLADMDAASAIERIRGELRQKELRIMTLAYDLAAVKTRCMQAGANIVVTKPVFPSDLYNALGEMTEGRVTILQETPVTYDFTGKRVLLVEDNALNSEIARMLLERVGFAVEIEGDGQKGSERFANSPDGYFDAVLMDIQMPLMNGYEATGSIRASAHPQARRIPILAMTADAFSEDVEKAAAAGMNGHISKPIDPELLYATLNRYLRTRET